MPDRYGDWPEVPSPQDIDHRAQVIAHCEFCDEDGVTPGGYRCRHIDYGAIAKRGMANLRDVMGWKGPTTHGKGERGSAGQ